MTENKKAENPIPEVKDEDLDAVAGGDYRHRQMYKYPCKGGCGTMMLSPDRYCESCLKKLNDQGVYPLI